MTFRLFTLMFGASALFYQAAHAEEMAHMTMETTQAPSTNSSTEAYKAIDAQMHKAMMATDYTGDADVDFLRGMIPHHQGAIDMANTVLKYGTDADVRMLAGDIIKAQENEIRMMKAWLAKHGPTDTPDAKASDMQADAPEAPAKPETTVSKPLLMTPGAVITLPDTVAKPSVSPTLVPAKASTLKKDIVTPVKTKTEATKMTATKATAPTTEAVVKAVHVVSGSLVTTSIPAVDAISATTAMHNQAIMAVTSALPDMPAPDAEIPNAAPKMEFLDGPGLGTPAKE